ncbi:MAG: DUF1707 domain-containing protein [Solirubrobacterales bacterium]|nr:DUF1707 domain-containing protein [Solirubrobacterales bacterium]
MGAIEHRAFRVAVGDVRASDAERDRCCRMLRAHYAAGRLEHDELEERLEQATRARTRADLRRLVADLPLESRLVPAGRRALRAVDRANAVAVRAHAASFRAPLLATHAAGSWALRRAVRGPRHRRRRARLAR